MNVDQFMKQIARVESGDPNAVNPDSGAQGMFQIMPANWSPWAAEAGLGHNAPKTAENQMKVARFKMQQYYDTFKDWGAVAAAWYGGPGAAQRYVANKADPYLSRKHGKYPSINDYINRVLGTTGANLPTTDDGADVEPDTDGDDMRKSWEYQLASFASFFEGGIGGMGGEA